MDLGLRGRRALVGAASGGLGYACAAALVAEGVRVAITGHDESRIAAAAQRLGNDTVALTVDLRDPVRCAASVRQAADLLGGLDILVSNGPGPRPGNFAATQPADYAAALDTSLLSVVHQVHAAVPLMQSQHWGRIVAITSVAVRQPIPGLILSNTARAGATGFLKTVAREIAGDGITVNSVLPGLHATQRVLDVFGEDLAEQARAIPAGAVGRPEDLGAVVAFLCSEPARFITGSALAVDGGADAALL